MPESKAKIIRARAALSDAAPFHFGSVTAQAQAIVDAAQKKADAILAKARAEVQARKDELVKGALEEGRKQGLKEGLQEGRAQGRKAGYDDAFQQHRAQMDEQCGHLRTTLEAAVHEFDRAHQELLKQAEADLLRLALAVAAKVVAREVTLDQGLVRASITRALELVSEKNSIELAVHPDDLAAAEQFVPELQRLFQDLQNVRLRADGQVDRGGVVLRTATGEIDARLHQQLARIGEVLLGAEAGGLVAAAPEAAAGAVQV